MNLRGIPEALEERTESREPLQLRQVFCNLQQRFEMEAELLSVRPLDRQQSSLMERVELAPLEKSHIVVKVGYEHRVNPWMLSHG